MQDTTIRKLRPPWGVAGRRARSLMSAAALLVMTTLLACRENTQPGEARALRDLLGDRYRAWERVPGFEARRSSDTAHGEEVEVFWNELARASAYARPFEGMRPGSVVIKEAFRDDKLINVAAMEKRHEGWFWAEWSASGEILFSGRPGLCIDCHRSGDDFLRSVTPSQGLP
jgi:hypothetical protein